MDKHHIAIELEVRYIFSVVAVTVYPPVGVVLSRVLFRLGDD